MGLGLGLVHTCTGCSRGISAQVLVKSWTLTRVPEAPLLSRFQDLYINIFFTFFSIRFSIIGKNLHVPRCTILPEYPGTGVWCHAGLCPSILMRNSCACLDGFRTYQIQSPKPQIAYLFGLVPENAPKP